MSEPTLFQGSAEPLAARMRPRTLDAFLGQEHLLGRFVSGNCQEGHWSRPISELGLLDRLGGRERGGFATPLFFMLNLDACSLNPLHPPADQSCDGC